MVFGRTVRVIPGFAAMLAAGIIALPGCSGGEDGGQDTAFSALGKACDADAECPGELSCHYDGQDYMSHRQCTLECSESAECEAAFGSNSFCIGAGVCVKACETDSECPDKSRCGGSGWCERSGKDSGNPYCGGSPTPCALLGDYECSGTLGCQRTGICTGVPPGCYGSSQYTCESTSGCYWSSFNDTCSGSPTPCSAHFTEASCIGALGCNYNGSCSGVPLTISCEDEHPALCEYTAGCYIVQP